MTHHLDLGTITLAKGAHPTREAGVCIMEATAWWAEEPHSDHPACVSPVIAAFLRTWNDGLPDGDRQMLVPLIPLVVGTATGAADDGTRAWMAADWLVRTHAPAWLRLAGLSEHADRLAGLGELTSAAIARAAKPVIAAARDAGDAAWDAAGAAAWDAARAAGDALRPTVVVLQASALDLVCRMTAVGRTVPA